MPFFNSFHLLFVLHLAIASPSHKPFRVAIIGGGVSGAASSHFLKQHFREVRGQACEIHLFEKSSILGGRLSNQFIRGKRYEAGGAVVHSSNRYFLDLVKTANLTLTRQNSESYVEGEDISNVIMWQGRKVLFELGPSTASRLFSKGRNFFCPSCPYIGQLLSKFETIAEISQLFVRYGVYTLWSVKNIISKILENNWSKVYDINFGPYKSAETFANSLNITDMAEMEGDTLLEKRDPWINDLFLEEVLSGINRVNYGQDTRINGFATAVSLAGFAVVGSLSSVEEGNNEVVVRISEREADEILLRSRVTKVLKSESNSDNKFELQYEDLESNTTARRNYDAVIIAAPLEFSGIDVSGAVGDYPHIRAKYKYQLTKCTFVVAEGLNPLYFNKKQPFDPQLILTPEYSDASVPFSCISRLDVLRDGLKVYKIFSRRHISDELLKNIFKGVEESQRRDWWAYPVLNPRPKETWPWFRLSDGIYFTNAMEILVSTIETQCVAAKNVVNLLMADRNGETIDGGEKAQKIVSKKRRCAHASNCANVLEPMNCEACA